MTTLSKQIVFSLAAAVLLSMARPASAVPDLQLSIAGGTYDTASETTVSAGAVFDLYAYLARPDNTGDFFLSMALSPAIAQSNPSPDLGFFKYDDGTGSHTVNVTADMLYGTPPIDAVVPTSDPGDLPAHGAFPTYFTELLIHFASTDLSELYDVAPSPATDPIPNNGEPLGSPATPSKDTMYFKKVAFDLSGLTGGAQLHFDLYDEILAKCGRDVCTPADIDAGVFAPFSHDAQSGSSSGGGGASGEVPEPGTLSLIGAGLVLGGLTWLRRRAANI